MTDQLSKTPQNEPLFNVPPLTLILTLGLVGVHLIRLVNVTWDAFLVAFFAFVPDLFSTDPLGTAYRLLSYTLLHFGWLHLAMNTGGMLAFGAGVEKIFGRTPMLGILIGGSLTGVLAVNDHVWLEDHAFQPDAGIVEPRPIPHSPASAGRRCGWSVSRANPFSWRSG